MIYVDFDDVLFNNKKFIQNEKSIFAKHGIGEDDFVKYYYDWVKNKKGEKIKIYSLENQLQGIEKELGRDVKELRKNLDEYLADTGKYIFDDVAAFLKKLPKKDLCLVSYSETEFQKKKIKNSGIAGYFSEVIITFDLKSEAIKELIKDARSDYFIDDRVSHLEDIKRKFPRIKTILMKRPEGRYDDDSSECCDHEVKNLSDVHDVISNDSF